MKLKIYPTKSRGLVFTAVATSLLLIAGFAGQVALAQLAGTGSIQGTVTDPSGAVIAGAQTTLTNRNTGVKHTAATSGGGLFSFPNIPIGSYSLSVTAPGFKAYNQSGIVLEVGSSIGVNVKMEVGAATQQVQVMAQGVALQTQTPNFRQTISRAAIHGLPINGRQMTSLISLSGAATPTPGNDANTSKNFFSSVTVSIAGGQGNMTDYRLDGGDNNDYMTNVNLPFPFPDAVSQFSVESTSLGAQDGTHPGGQVNVVTMSGTNAFHGDAFEFIRNNIINANNFFSNTPDQLHQNQFGGTLGGPILRNKLFFFAGYQRLTSNSTQSSKQAFVPTPANLNGDFSVTDGPNCLAGGKSAQLLNPQTGAVLPNNQINPSFFSPISLSILTHIPAATDSCGSVIYAIPSNQRENQFITREDITISSRQNLFVRYFLDGYSLPAFFNSTNMFVTQNPGLSQRAQSLTLGYNFIFSSHLVNSFNATVTRRRNNRGPAPNAFHPAQFGINVYDPDPNYFELAAANKWSIYCGTCATSVWNVNNFSGSDNVNWVIGRHQLVFGGEFARGQFNSNAVFQGNGNWDFTGNFSQKGPAGTSPGGTGADANLDFLTGALGNFQQSMNQQNALRMPMVGLYVQDTWQATPKIVLTGGVRWDPQFFPTDYFGRGVSFNSANFLSNTHSSVFTNAPAGTLYYGDKGVHKNFTQNSVWQFSPRVGATYNPDGEGKMVFRVGYAIMYDLPNFYTSNRIHSSPPFATNVVNLPTNTPLDFADPWSTGSAAGTAFPIPFHPPSDFPFPKAGAYVVMQPNFKPPYEMQYTASVQRQLPDNWMMEISYIGNKSTHMTFGFPLNPAVYIPGTCGTGPCSTLGNTASRFILTLKNPIAGPGYSGGGNGNVSTIIADGATANYNGLIASVQHRVSNFDFLANYTWSHCIDIADAQGDVGGPIISDANDIRRDYGSCGFDYRSMFNADFIATSHFSELHGWSGRFVNNWQLGAIFRATSGEPFTVVTGIDNSLTAMGRDRPDLVSPGAVYTHKKLTRTTAGNRQYISSAAFAPNAIGTFGDVGRNSFVGPKYANLDLAVSRLFPVTERAKLDFRIEAFNAINHPNFSTPAVTLNSSTFGQVTSTVSSGATGDGGSRIFQGAIKVIF